jgi:hypothetical protein
MGFFDGELLGIHIFIWVYFLISILAFIGVLIYWQREKIKENYYKWRFPEKLLKVIIHYPSGLYRIFFRLIPTDSFFIFDGKTYNYLTESVLKQNDFFIYKDSGKAIAKIEDKIYNLEDRFKIKRKDAQFPEIHYIYDCPLPIDFNSIDNKLKLSGSNLTDLKENDLLKKLLTLEQEKSMLMIIMLLVGFNILATLFIIAKMMGWIK